MISETIQGLRKNGQKKLIIKNVSDFLTPKNKF